MESMEPSAERKSSAGSDDSKVLPAGGHGAAGVKCQIASEQRLMNQRSRWINQ